MTEGLHVGPILLGTALPAHILSPTVTSRGVVNMAALARRAGVSSLCVRDFGRPALRYFQLTQF